MAFTHVDHRQASLSSVVIAVNQGGIASVVVLPRGDRVGRCIAEEGSCRRRRVGRGEIVSTTSCWPRGDRVDDVVLAEGGSCR